MNRTESRSRNTQIIAEYNNLSPIHVIAKSHNLSPSHVMGVVRTARQNGEVTRTPRSKRVSVASLERSAAIVDAYNAGQTLESIGESYAITRERVRQILEGQGVSRRSPQERATKGKAAFMAKHGALIDEKFDVLRSTSLVIASLKGTPAGVPKWIHERLRDRKSESVTWSKASKVWTDDDLLDFLRLASSASPDATLSTKGYSLWRSEMRAAGNPVLAIPPTHSVFTWRFGSWNAALQAAGLSVNAPRRDYQRQWTESDTFAAVGTYVESEIQAGRKPTFSEYEKYAKERKGTVPSGAYIRYLTGMSWSEILYRIHRGEPSAND